MKKRKGRKPAEDKKGDIMSLGVIRSLGGWKRRRKIREDEETKDERGQGRMKKVRK